MQQEARDALARAGRARDHHDGRSLGIGARDGVDEVEGTGAIGDDGNAQAAVIARGGICRESHRRLMAQGDIRQDAALLDHLEQRQHEISGDAEDLACTMISERGEQGMRKGRHQELLTVSSGTLNASQPQSFRAGPSGLNPESRNCFARRLEILGAQLLT
jgi:hypothetical protein